MAEVLRVLEKMEEVLKVPYKANKWRVHGILKKRRRKRGRRMNENVSFGHTSDHVE
jgi:hypothetical protein